MILATGTNHQEIKAYTTTEPSHPTVSLERVNTLENNQGIQRDNSVSRLLNKNYSFEAKNAQ